MKFFDLYPICHHLATFGGGEVGAALESISVQVFDGSHLYHPDRLVLDAFARIADTSAIAGDYLDFSHLLGTFGYELFCYGSVALITDSRESGEPRFRFIRPDYKNRAEHGARFDNIVDRITLHSRDKRLHDDPDYGEPYLMPAIPHYLQLLGVERTDIGHLQRIIEDRQSGNIKDDDVLQHHKLHAQRSALYELMLEAAGLVRVVDDVPHFRPEQAAALARDTIKAFTASILEPFRVLIEAPAVPDVIIPRLA